jgi:hypothetical protein
MKGDTAYANERNNLEMIIPHNKTLPGYGVHSLCQMGVGYLVQASSDASCSVSPTSCFFLSVLLIMLPPIVPPMNK